jgi:hypothetical protein
MKKILEKLEPVGAELEGDGATARAPIIVYSYNDRVKDECETVLERSEGNYKKKANVAIKSEAGAGPTDKPFPTVAVAPSKYLSGFPRMGPNLVSRLSNS